jgi:hypothetical protein
MDGIGRKRSGIGGSIHLKSRPASEERNINIALYAPSLPQVVLLAGSTSGPRSSDDKSQFLRRLSMARGYGNGRAPLRENVQDRYRLRGCIPGLPPHL